MDVNFLPTIIEDNFFDDVDSVISFANSVEYYEPQVGQWWSKYRSSHIENIDKKFSDEVLSKTLSYYGFSLQDWYGNCMFHKIQPPGLGGNWYHVDDAKLAGVIYLSDGDIETGTTLLDQNKQKKVIVANRKNTMIAYDATRFHAPSSIIHHRERLCIVLFLQRKGFLNNTEQF